MRVPSISNSMPLICDRSGSGCGTGLPPLPLLLLRAVTWTVRLLRWPGLEGAA